MARLTQLVQSGRRVTAEIEDRRLHLKAGYNSLFAYCLSVHGMSEDEACRRIEVARLGRRFKPIFGLLASGRLSLSVAALLKDCLTDQNQTSLLAAVSGKSVRAAREELAARFPLPDVPSTIRKLPQRRASFQATPSASQAGSAQFGMVNAATSNATLVSSTRDIAGDLPATSDSSRLAHDTTGDLSTNSVHPTSTCDIARDPHSLMPIPSVEVAVLVGHGGESSRHSSECADRPCDRDDSMGAEEPAIASGAPATFRAHNPSRSERARIEPIARERYRVQFTASLPQKQKLELALDLMSHRNPGRDVAVIVESGLDLLIEKLLRTRMGKTNRPQSAARKSRKTRVSSATRRIVAERDGLRCAFVDEHGRRCEGRAFREFDHEQPLGKDGGSEPVNVRLLCRAHNRYSAELEYGRAKIDREIARSNIDREIAHPKTHCRTTTISTRE